MLTSRLRRCVGDACNPLPSLCDLIYLFQLPGWIGLIILLWLVVVSCSLSKEGGRSGVCSAEEECAEQGI